MIISGLSTGGAEMMLLKLLQNIDRQKYSLTVISLTSKGDLGPHISALGVPVISLNISRNYPSPVFLFRLAHVLYRLRPDIVHTWMYHADLLGGVVARIVGLNNVIWGIRQSNLSKDQNKRLTLWIVKICAILSRIVPSHILTCSNRAGDVHGKVGYAADKFHVIPNGFDLERFYPDSSSRSNVRSELGLDESTQIVGLIARFDSQKNHIGFIEAASHVYSFCPQVHFILVGAGVDDGNVVLRNAIAARGLRENVHMLGRRVDIPRLMASLDILASSSHGEAFPNVLGEAMACGVPCVVTDAGDSAEIVGATGRVVSVGDMLGLANNILDLLQLSKDERVGLGVQARERVKANYEIKYVTRLYEAFYELSVSTKDTGVF